MGDIIVKDGTVTSTITVTIEKTMLEIVNDIYVYDTEIKEYELKLSKINAEKSSLEVLIKGKKNILNQLNQLLSING